ncbi:MAG TPA: hypothetical protein VF187_03785 [Gemmatimonadales bacterium]
MLRAPYRGAVSLFGLALGWQGKLFFVLLLLTLLILAGPLHGLRLAGRLAGVALVAGAAGGAASGLLEPLGRRGRSANGLRWALSIFTYLMVASILVPIAPFSLPDPAFFWIAGTLSVLGATGLVLTDDRGPGRLPPHQYRLVRSLIALRAAPRRYWAATEERLTRYDQQRKALEAERALRPEAEEELQRLLGVMGNEISGVRSRLERFGRLTRIEPDLLAEADTWLRHIEEGRTRKQLTTDNGQPERGPGGRPLTAACVSSPRGKGLILSSIEHSQTSPRRNRECPSHSI